MRAVIISIFCLVLGTALFFTGLHSIDNAWNMQAGMMDKSILLNFDKGSLYEAGIMMTFAGFFISVAAALTVFINFKIERDEKKFKDEGEF
jgi:hypothetical protein